MVETESPWSGSAGTPSAPAAVYQGLTPLSAEDVADVVAFCVTRPPARGRRLRRGQPVAQASATSPPAPAAPDRTVRLSPR